MLYRFENAERRIDRVESEAEARSMGHNRTLADEIAGLEDNDAVEAELEKLKSRMSSSGGNPAKEKKDV